MFSSVNTCWTLVAAFLVYFMQAGFALCEAGFTRAKNTGNILMKNMMDFCIGTPCYWIIGFGFGKGYPADRVEAEQSNKKILDGVRAVAFKPLIEILKGIDQDLLKGAIAGEHFQEQFFADCKDPELAAYVKTLL